MSAAEEEIREVTAAPDQALIQAISKAELDQAITTARAFPRSVKEFMDECMQLATLNTEIADDCIYALPRREKDKATGKWVTKNIEGPSARLAEIVLHSWGNCRGGARVVAEERDFVVAQGVFHDLQKNVHITFEVKRRISTSEGKRYNSDMIGVTGNAACSIALRNAVFKGVPKALWSPVYEAARKVCIGDQRTLANRRADALAALQKQGATPEMVLTLLGVKGIDDITLDHLTTLRGVFNSIKEGETTVERAFAPPEEDATAKGSRAEQAKDALKKNATPKTEDKQPEGNIPQHDAKSAIAAIRAFKTRKELTAGYEPIVLDFVNTNRQVPPEVESAFADWMAHLESLENKD